jgi:TfoX/Sxy family transcriptional regulator of competence genes
MAYDDELAERIRGALAGRDGITERRMFGGLGFMLNGNMCVGVIGDEMVARLGPEEGDRALDEPHTRPMDFTGRPMSGWIFVETPALADPDGLEAWVGRAVSYVSALPSK